MGLAVAKPFRTIRTLSLEAGREHALRVAHGSFIPPLVGWLRSVGRLEVSDELGEVTADGTERPHSRAAPMSRNSLLGGLPARGTFGPSGQSDPSPRSHRIGLVLE